MSIIVHQSRLTTSPFLAASWVVLVPARLPTFSLAAIASTRLNPILARFCLSPAPPSALPLVHATALVIPSRIDCFRNKRRSACFVSLARLGTSLPRPITSIQDLVNYLPRVPVQLGRGSSPGKLRGFKMPPAPLLEAKKAPKGITKADHRWARWFYFWAMQSFLSPSSRPAGSRSHHSIAPFLSVPCHPPPLRH